jgi:NAD(P)-dependent dehydrogenase (short-subunit alcohol dehydrogenase family)
MSVTYDFSGQVALVTGAAMGMGLATAGAFAEAGAAVTLADIDQQALDEAVAGIRSAGGSAIGVICDVADEAQVAAMIEKTVAEFGRLDAAFNNAGIQLPTADLSDLSAQAFDRITAINLRGVWACMKHELIQMTKQGSGAIVNNSSVGGIRGRAQLAAYHATKHGVLGLTSSAGKEYASRGIRINAICPGATETPMVNRMIDEGVFSRDDLGDNPICRIARPEEMAQTVMWLCSPGSSFVVAHALVVDGGSSA